MAIDMPAGPSEVCVCADENAIPSFVAAELQIGISFFLLFWIFIYLLLVKLTNSNTPILDSLVSSSAVASMWWMTKRKMENWIAWIFSNIIAIPLNFYKGFMLFTLMYVLFLAIAVSGYREWKEKLNSN